MPLILMEMSHTPFWIFRMGLLRFCFVACWMVFVESGFSPRAIMAQELPFPEIRPRVMVSTDIGGTDPDDIQSMVHLLLYADVLDLEGIVSSPYGPGRRKHILQAIDAYEKDFPRLIVSQSAYPEPEFLRSITHQGATDLVGA
ncbi:MAG: nucleoside hydrolase-like domain-containing protein, partial [Limisphaerales bacterium]